MATYQFTGNWENEAVHLPVFEQFDRFAKRRDDKTGIPLRYYDMRSMSPDPMPEQLAAVRWLTEEGNQRKVLAALLPYFRDVITPQWKKHTSPEEYPDAYPPLNEVEDLRNLFSIGEIAIQPNGLDGRSGIQLHFSTPMDYEHGLSVEILGARVVGWGEGYEVGNDTTYPPDMERYWPPEFSSWEEQKIMDREDRNWYTPHPKYGTLREWQQTQNLYLPNRLFRQGDQEKLQKLLRDHPEVYQRSGSELIRLAVEKGGVENMLLVRQILEQLDNVSHRIANTLIEHDRYEDLEFAIARGYDITDQTDSSAPMNKQLVAWYRDYEDLEKVVIARKRVQWLVEHGVDVGKTGKYKRTVFGRIEWESDKARVQEIKRVVARWAPGSTPPSPSGKLKVKPAWWKRLFDS